MSRRSRLFVTTAVQDWGRSPLSRVPNTVLALDVQLLVIAGGASGRYGGGGAGGLLNFTSETLFIGTNYSVTIGAGGAVVADGSNSQFGSLTAAVGGGQLPSQCSSSGGRQA